MVIPRFPRHFDAFAGLTAMACPLRGTISRTAHPQASDRWNDQSMNALSRLRPFSPDPAALCQPLPFDVFNHRGVLFSRMGSILSDQRQLLGRQQLFRAADDNDAEPSDCATVAALVERAHDYSRIAGVWGGEARDAQRIDDIAQSLILLVRANSALCSGMAMHMPLDSHAVRHSFAVAITAVTLGIWLELDDRTLATVARAALTMNVASLALHDDCATVRGRLEPGRRSDIGSHPLLAANRLMETPGIDVRWINAVEQHHENTDGSGYPYGNSRDDIPLEARILRVADVWCALANPGADRILGAPKAILDDMFRRERRRLDDHALCELRKQFGAHPPGSLVRLANRETALVTTWTKGAAAPGFVVTIMTPSGEIDHRPKVRLTGKQAYGIRAHASFSVNQLRKVPWGKVWATAS
jgi:HD-GYP domain-containing protein (c-di-GMP phosphodiesterase class II)